MIRMLNKKEVLYRLGISLTNPKRKKVFEDLPKYDNPYSKTMIFKESDLAKLIDGFKVAK